MLGAPPERPRLLKVNPAPEDDSGAEWGPRASWMGQSVGERGSEEVGLEEICTPGWTLRTTLGAPRSAAHANVTFLLDDFLTRSAASTALGQQHACKLLKLQSRGHGIFILKEGFSQTTLPTQTTPPLPQYWKMCKVVLQLQGATQPLWPMRRTADAVILKNTHT